MLKKHIFLFALLCPLFLIAQQAVNIIPQPVSIKINNGNFIIDENTAVKFNTQNKDLQAAARFFSEYKKYIWLYITVKCIKEKTN